MAENTILLKPVRKFIFNIASDNRGDYCAPVQRFMNYGIFLFSGIKIFIKFFMLLLKFFYLQKQIHDKNVPADYLFHVAAPLFCPLLNSLSYSKKWNND